MWEKLRKHICLIKHFHFELDVKGQLNNYAQGQCPDYHYLQVFPTSTVNLNDTHCEYSQIQVQA